MNALKHTDDLNDPLDDILAAPVEFRRPVAPAAAIAQVEAAYSEPCRDCGGSGQFRSYTGRLVGRCFKCEGKGRLTFKTSPDKRAAARAQAAGKRAEAATSREVEINAWQAANPAEWAWIQANAGRFDFATAMAVDLGKFGRLTPGQFAAVQRCIAKDAARKVAAVERAANAPAISIERVEQAFGKALTNGLKNPKLRLAGFTFSPAKASSANAGALYVKTGETYLGKIMGGKFLAARECTPEQQAEVLAVASDPSGAAIAYGRRTGNCACCGRTLTKGESIDRGIGPICAETFGW